MTQRVLNNHKARSIIHIQWSHEGNPIQPSSSLAQWFCGGVPAMDGQWQSWRIVSIRINWELTKQHAMAPWIHQALCFVLVNFYMCHKPISVLIKIFTLLAWCLLNTLVILTLTMRELRHWPSISGMSPQSNCGDEEDRRIGLFSWLHCIYFALLYLLYNIFAYHIKNRFF